MKDIIISGLLIYICLISIISLVITVIDKFNAKRNLRRVPESTLLTIAALGGSVAMYITMQIIRHKTKHIKFMLGLPIIILFQVIAIFYLFTQIL